MSFELSDLTRKELDKLISEKQMKPALTSQNPYIGNGPDYEMLAGMKPNGLYNVQLLDKKQVEKFLENTIRVFREFAKGENS
jgi:hypothetical protein